MFYSNGAINLIPAGIINPSKPHSVSTIIAIGRDVSSEKRAVSPRCSRITNVVSVCEIKWVFLLDLEKIFLETDKSSIEVKEHYMTIRF